MKIRFLIAQFICKVGFCLSKVTKNDKSEAFGKAALKICPNALEQINCNGGVILVTGSDRGAAAFTILNVLNASMKNVLSVQGNNNKSHITGKLLAMCRPFGKIKRDYLLCEAEDFSAAEILSSLSPDYAVITNLLHTTPEKNGLPEMIKEKIEKSINKNTLLILNANDPLLSGISVASKSIFFSIDDENSTRTSEPVFGIRCPKCGAKLEYSKVYTAHIGMYSCINGNCDFKTPETVFTATNIDYERKRMQVMGYGVAIQMNGELIYNKISSVCAAITLCNIIGIEMKHATSHASTIKHSDDFDFLKFGERKVKLISVTEDAANFENAVASISKNKNGQKKSVILYLNNKNPQKDVSWLYDADISRLHNSDTSVIVCGNRAFDLAVRLKLEGYDKTNLKIIDDIDNIRKHINILHDDVSLLCFVEGSRKDKQKDINNLVNKMHAHQLSR